MISKAFTCPRRTADGADRTDTWKSDRGLVGQARGCSYCGSMHPDDFMAAVRAGKEIGPTDKPYKIYVDSHSGKFYTHHLAAEQSEEFRELYLDGKINVGYPGHFYAKLYLPGLEPKE